jgi:hypothetical protein
MSAGTDGAATVGQVLTIQVNTRLLWPAKGPVMLLEIRKRTEAEVIPLLNAVFCLDCEAISASSNDDCPACGGRSLASMAKLLHGSLRKERGRVTAIDVQLFDATLAIDLRQISAGGLGTLLGDLEHITGPRLAQGDVSIQMKVKPVAEKCLVVKRAA